MKRAENSELTHRINEAFILLKKELPNSQILVKLINQFGVSRVQAYRYIQEALRNEKIIPVPEKKSVFTVKLSQSIIYRIRNFAKYSGISISDVVREALENFLKKKKHVQEKQ